MNTKPLISEIDYVLFPGRHHLFTKFQAEYLEQVMNSGVTLLDGGVVVAKKIVIAITSGDHSGTRRNPIPGHRRVQMAEHLLADSDLSGTVHIIPDVSPTGRFAKYMVEAVRMDDGPELTPENCVVACSTPEVISLFESLGFRIAPVELEQDGSFRSPRPWDVLEMIVDGEEAEAVNLLHDSSRRIWEQYKLSHHVLETHADPMLTDDGDITETRNYEVYRMDFDDGADRKWSMLRDHVKPGRIVDIGCGAGAILREAASDPHLAESDLYGVEAARPLLEECLHRRKLGAFTNPNTFFHQRNFLSGKVFPKQSIDTTLTVSLCHEIFSYLGEQALLDLVERIYEQTRPGGVWANLDVLGPENGSRMINLALSRNQLHKNASLSITMPANHPNNIPKSVDLHQLHPDERADYLSGLTPLENFIQFIHDFKPRAHPELAADEYDWCLIADMGGSEGDISIETSRRLAMEWLSKKDYHDSWLSEMQESFCHYDYLRWKDIVESVGFEVAPGSGSFKNEWLINNRFMSTAKWEGAMNSGHEEWPDTHVLMVARRP